MKFSGLRFTNISLLVLVLILTLTGVYGLFWTVNGWMFTVHRAAGWGLIALLPWKAVISYRSLRRGLKPNLNRGIVVMVSLLLAAVTLTVLGLVLLWKGRFGPADYWLRQTAISWHWMLALGLLAPFAVHVWRRWPKLKKVDLVSRRGALRIILAGSIGLIGYTLAQAAARQREQPEAPRRFTGSRRDSDFSGNRFPVTQSFPVRADQIDPKTWRLQVSGKDHPPIELTYAELLAMPTREIPATLDCTLGWYTTQMWRGVPLTELLAQAGISRDPLIIRLESVTGYAHDFPYAEAKDIILATHVGGEPLNSDHGYPLRAVVPSRRGWFWVKWLAKIDSI